MKISTRGRYSLRLLLDLAERRDEGFVALKDVARRQGISKKYLEQLVTLLGGSDVLRSNRGYQGGYMLAKEPSNYTVGQILRLTEGTLCPVACLEDDPVRCERSGICMTLPVWKGLQKVIDGYLDGITLQDVLDAEIDAKTEEHRILEY